MAKIHGKPKMTPDDFNYMLLMIGALTDPFVPCTDCGNMAIKTPLIVSYQDVIIVPFHCESCDEILLYVYDKEVPGQVMVHKPDYEDCTNLVNLYRMDKDAKKYLPIIKRQRRKMAGSKN